MLRGRYKVFADKVRGIMPEQMVAHDLEPSEMLNRHGAEGWELVAVINSNDRRDTDPTVLYGYTILTYHFKKPIELNSPSPLPWAAIRERRRSRNGAFEGRRHGNHAC